MARHLFDDNGADYAILNPLTRGNIADYLLNSRICAAVNDWLLDRWLDPDTSNRFRGTIRVNPEDVRGAVAEIERLADHPKMVQVGVPMQSREPYGKPMFEPIWEAAAAHGLPVAVHINGGNGVDHAPTFAGHAYTYPGYARVHAVELVRPSGDADHRRACSAGTPTCGSCSPTAATTSSHH